MHMFLKGAAIALALAGATFATAGTANAQGISIGISDNGRHNSGSAIMFSFGDVAYGYRDGYWDNDHRWHNWRNRHDRDNYRGQYGDRYRNGYHHRYRGQGWMSDSGRDNVTTGVSFNFGNVAFAYRDGYWDNDHRWHKWRNSREHREYRNQHGDNYRNGYHHRYRGQGWQRD